MWTIRRSNNTSNRSHDDHRSPYERDNTRVIHSAAFRRLQRKTQILGTDEGDFHRTRLTHSLEVASIAKSLVRNFKHRDPKSSYLPSDDLISAISLLHDIGHPPFGHGGEVALNYRMKEAGGFEGNGQTLRLISHIEDTYGAYGLDLTRRTLLGVLKYPAPYSTLCKKKFRKHQSNPIRINDWLPPKCFLDSEAPLVEWLLDPLDKPDKTLLQTTSKPTKDEHGHTQYRSLDSSIMTIADDIAYGVHDFEDAVYLKLIQREHTDTPSFGEIYESANHDKCLPSFASMMDALFHPENMIRKNAIGELVNFFVTSTTVSINPLFNEHVLSHNAILAPQAHLLLNSFKDIIFNHVIDSPEARTIEFGGQTVVLKLFEAIESNPLALLSLIARKKFLEADTEQQAKRHICDHIANMTDEYAYRMHERLFGFNTRTVFERL